jgi:hypothetical protein
MVKRAVILARPSDAKQAHDYVERAFKAGGYAVEFKKATRTLEQNAKMWADLEDITRAKPIWNGVRMSPRIWKSTFMLALNIEQEMAPNLDGPGAFPTGFRSSELNKQQFSELLELIQAFAAREGIALRSNKDAA